MKLFPLFLRETLQPTFWLSLGALFILALGVGLFAESLALSDGKDARLTLTGWSLRLLAVTFWIVWLNGTLSEEREARFDQVLFSLPFSRFSLLAQRLASWMAAALAVGLIACLFLTALGASAFSALAWSLSFVLELWIVGALILFVSSGIRNASAAILLALLFYLFLRLLSYVSALAQHALQEQAAPWVAETVRQLAQWLSVIFPPLNEYAASSWLTGAVDGSALSGQLLHGVLFMLALLFAAGHDYNKRAAA